MKMNQENLVNSESSTETSTETNFQNIDMKKSIILLSFILLNSIFAQKAE